MKIKLAEALLRRKELQEKVDVLRRIDAEAIYEPVVTRRQVHEGVDDVLAKVPKLTASQVTAEYDWHARQLRELDSVIQQANWSTEVEVKPDNMADFSDRAAATEKPEADEGLTRPSKNKSKPKTKK